MATALSCVLDELPVVHYQMVALGGSVRVAPYATFGTQRLADLTLDAMADRSAALMSNHGTLCIGADLGAAVDNSLLQAGTDIAHTITRVRESYLHN